MIDPRTPVIVAVEQRNHRESGSEPIAAMATAVDPLLTSSDPRRRLASKVTSLRVMRGLWPYRNPGRMLADDLGLGPVQTTLSPIGGNEVYDLVNTTASDIQSGSLEAAVICAAETGRTRRSLKAAGDEPAYRSEPDDAAPDLLYGNSRRMLSDRQAAVGAWEATVFYALVESALRHAAGESVEAHRSRIAELWASTSEVASQNPHAWLTDKNSATDIATVSAANRMVATPYPKLMTANIDVDQSAAVLMCSLGAARDAGFSDDQLVFLASGAGAHDHWAVEERWSLHESPAMRAAGARAVALAGRSVGDIADIDLYSCFPSAVQVAQAELGIDPARPFTITGGLTFAGGPFNSYCLHTLATAFERIVGGVADSALLSGNGGFFSNHSFVVLGNTAPEHGFRYDRPQAEVDALPARPPSASAPDGGLLESYSVVFGREAEPSHAVATVLDSAGARHWARSEDADVVGALLEGEHVESSVDLASSDDGNSVLRKVR